MKRKVLLAVVLVGAVVIQASQASEKGINYAHFSGPGLHHDGVTIIRGDLRQTGLLEVKRNALASFGLSRRDLGPAYRAEYRMDYAPRATLRQVVYPYAQGGPITFTPRGQHIGHDYEPFRGGWYAGKSSLLAYLIAHGFPRSDPREYCRVIRQTSREESGCRWLKVSLARIHRLASRSSR